MALKPVEILITARDNAKSVIDKLRQSATGLAKSLRGVKPAAKQAEDAQDQLKNSTNTLSNSFKTAALRIGAVVGAAIGLNAIKRGFLEIINTGARFEILNKQLAAVMGTVEGGEAAFAWIEDFAKNTPLQLEDVTKSFVRMKAFGLDPMDGTMQKLVDANAKLGGSQETLNGIILAVGQAWTKQKLQAEEANQLIERGIPVWELLAKSMGKTTAEVIELSTQGEIGQKQIAGLINAIGDSATGAAADQMKTLTGLTSNLSDTWTRFLNTIAESGILDHVKGQLQDLSDTIQGMAEDGSLQQWARDISETLVAVSDVIGIYADAIRASFNSVQIAAKAFFNPIGVLSKQFREGIADDASDIKKSLNNIAEKFSTTSKASRQSAEEIIAAEQSKADAVKSSSEQIIAANEQIGQSWDELVKEQEEAEQAAEQAARKAAAAAQAQAEASRGALIQQQAQAAAAIDAENSAHVARQRSILQSQQLQQQQAEASEQQERTAQESAAQADALAAILTRLRDRVAEYGDAWVDTFNKQQVTFEGEGGAFFFERLEKSFTNTINIAKQFNREIEKNTETLHFMAEGGAASSGQLEIMRDLMQESLKDADKLSEANLDKLKNSIAAANQQLGEMAAFSKSAADTLTTLKNNLDQLNDNDAAIEQRKLQEERLKLEENLQEARRRGNQEAATDLQESIGLLNEINTIKQQNIAIEKLTTIGISESAQELTAMRNIMEDTLNSSQQLSQANVDKLKDSIQRANRELEKMNDFADSASDKLDTLKDEWDRLNDNEVDIEQRRIQKERLELQEALQEAIDRGNEQEIITLQKALSLLTQINQKKQQNNALDAASSATQAVSNSAATPTPAPAPTQPAATSRTVNLQFVIGNTNQTINAAFDSQNDADHFLEILKQMGTVS